MLPGDAEVLDWMVPAPGQGCVAVVMRKDHPQCDMIQQKVNHLQTETWCLLSGRQCGQLKQGARFL